MKLLSAIHAKTQFGQMIDMAQKEPVRLYIYPAQPGGGGDGVGARL